MKAVPVLDADEAVAQIPDGSTIAFAASGGGILEPDALCQALGRRYVREGAPGELTLVHALGIGDGKERGLNALAEPGMVRRIIGGHWSWAPPLQELASSGAIEAHVWPAGVISTWMREIGAGRPGVVTRIGIDTFVDPRENPDDLIEVVTLGDRDYLWFKPQRIDVALIRASRADRFGNLSFDDEAAKLDVQAAALAAAADGGRVIAQVREVCEPGELDPRRVHIPGLLVDAVVVEPDQWQTYAAPADAVLSGATRAELTSVEETSNVAKRIIARRAALEVAAGDTIAVGFGASADVVNVLAQQGRLDDITICIEQGHIGGVPEAGYLFGAARNSYAIIPSTETFDMIGGGVLDVALLGMGETDRTGAVNVSHLGTVVGPGGFIDIAQNAARLVFCGTFTAKGLVLGTDANGLRIESDGEVEKFVERVQAATVRTGSPACRATEVTWVTERCVFRLIDGQLALVEYAPGVSVSDDIVAHMGFEPVMANPTVMDSSLFV